MKDFNSIITKILEDVNLDDVSIDHRSEITTPSDQRFIAHTIEQFKEGQIDKKKAGRILRHTAAETKENKPLTVVADFIDILNQSTKTGNVINAGAIRRLARSLGIKQGALNHLEQKDQVIALQLIQADFKQEASKSPRSSMVTGMSHVEP